MSKEPLTIHVELKNKDGVEYTEEFRYHCVNVSHSGALLFYNENHELAAAVNAGKWVNFTVESR